MSRIDEYASTIKPNTFPKFRQELTSMLSEMEEVYQNQPVETHAKSFAEILCKFECV